MLITLNKCVMQLIEVHAVLKRKNRNGRNNEYLKYSRVINLYFHLIKSLYFVCSRRSRRYSRRDLCEGEGGHLRAIRTEYLGSLQGPAAVTSCPPRSARAQHLDPATEATSLIIHDKYH